MKAKGSSYLKVTGVLEIIYGVATLAMTIWLLNTGDGSMIAPMGIKVAIGALLNLVMIFVISAIQIIGGLVGVSFANKPQHYTACFVFGVLLILCEVYAFLNVEYTVTNIILHLVFLLVPVCYLVGAKLNKESLEK